MPTNSLRANEIRFPDGTNAESVYSVKAPEYGAKGDGVTDDAAAINACIAAASAGGVVHFPAGTYIVGSTINLPTSTTVPLILRGAGVNATTIKLKNSANVDVVSHSNFASLTGTSSTGGVFRVAIQEMTIDGNKANNTSGYGIRLYGKGYSIRNVAVQNAKNDGIYTEYGGADSFTDPTGKLEATFYNVEASFNGGAGWTFKGPHDTIVVGLVALSNGTWGWNAQKPCHATHVNAYLNTSGGIWISSTGAVNGSDIVGSTATGWGMLIDTGTGACQMSSCSFGGPIALEIRSPNHVISGNVSNSTTAGVKFGSGSASLQLSMSSNSGYWFDVAGATNGSTVQAISQDTTGTLFNGTPSGTWLIQGGDVGHVYIQTSGATSVIHAGGWAPILPATNGNIVAESVSPSFSAAVHVSTAALATQTGSIFQGSGVPSNANGNNGDIYFRTDTPGTANQRMYIKSAGAWVALTL